MLTSALIERIVALLEERFGLDALLVFGSEVTGTRHRGSDLDLAALFRRRPDPLALLDARTALEEICGTGVMRRMTGFRNVAVHECRNLDPSILDAIVRNRLGDLRAFARIVLERFRI